MIIVLRFIRAEYIKYFKSWVLLTVLLAPLCQTGFLFTILWFSEDLVFRFRPGFQFWIELNYLAWNLIFLPVVTALISELSWDLESESNAWNLLLIQPVPRGIHYITKVLSHLLLIFIAQIILAVLLIPEGLILRTHLDSILDHKSIWGSIPTETLIQFAFFSLAASVSMIVAHTWLSTRRPGLAVSIVTALGGTWCCAKLAGNSPIMQLLPWGTASQITTFFDRWNRHIPWDHLPGSLLSATLLVWFGTLGFTRNRETRY